MKIGLREKKRLEAMRRAQSVAIPLFQERGFVNVSVEEVAAAAEVAPVSLYRYFGTKENIVIWDEHDAAIYASVAMQLRSHHPFEAVKTGIINLLGSGGGSAAPNIRMALIVKEPVLLAAARANTARLGRSFAQLFAQHRGAPGPSVADRAAGAAAAAVLQVCIEISLEHDGHKRINQVIEEAFDALSWNRSRGGTAPTG